MPDDRNRLRAALLEIDVAPATLRADPRGTSWLAPELRHLTEVDVGCRAELRAFVERERELFEGSRSATDPFFTARVLGSLPEPLAGTGLSPRERVAILAGFYAAAAGLLYFMLWVAMPERTHGWLETAQTVVDGAETTLAGRASR